MQSRAAAEPEREGFMLLLSSPGVILQALGAAVRPAAPQNIPFSAFIEAPEPFSPLTWPKGDCLHSPLFEPMMMMLLSWQEQEAANDIGVTSFTVLLINGGVGGDD